MHTTKAASLQTRIFALAVAAMVVVGVTVAAVGILPFHSAMTDSVEAELDSAFDHRASAAEEALVHLQGLAKQVSSRSAIRDAMMEYNRGRMDLDGLREFTREKISDAMRLAPEIRGIARFARDGALVVAVGEPLRGEDWLTTQLGRPYRTEAGFRVAVTSMVRGPDAQIEGKDILVVDLGALARLAADTEHLGETGETIIAAPAPLFPRRFATPIDHVLAKAREIAHTAPPPFRAGEDLVAARLLRGTDWLLVVRIRAAEVYQHVDELMLWVALGAAATVAAGVWAFIAVLRPLSGRLLVETEDLAAQLERERKTAAALERTSRAMRTLSASNQAVVRASSECQLLGAMCNAIVLTGGYEFAWVGLRADGALREAARLGAITDGWVEAITETAGMAGAKGSSLQSAETPLRRYAQHCGIEGIAALPLMSPDGKALGMLMIGAATVPAEDEMAVFHELATDLAFGLDTLRLRGERERAFGQTIAAVAALAEVRDPYTADHQRRVAELARAIAGELGLDEERRKGIYIAGLVHDIGKIAVPAEILTRPGKLNEVEFDLIKTHASVGYDILKGIDLPWPVAQAVHQHHERLDGGGYPQGLAGEQIIVEARILAVADVVEAIAADRPYRPGLGVESALAEVFRYKGTRYDADVVDACHRIARTSLAAILIGKAAGAEGASRPLAPAA